MSMNQQLERMSDAEADRKVGEAAAALDDAIANPKPQSQRKGISETPGYGATLAGKGKSERRTQIVRTTSDGQCEEPECHQKATVELRYHRHGSPPNSASVFRGDFCEKHAKSVARLMGAFGHRPIDGQEEYWQRPEPVWKAPEPKPKQSAKTRAAAAEVVAGAEAVKAEAEKSATQQA